MLTTSALAALAITHAGAANTTNTQLRHSRDVVRFFDNHGWLRAPNQTNCTAVPWTGSCRIARRHISHRTANGERLERRLWRELPQTNDWRTSVRLAQRIYPGTDQ